MTQTDHDPDHKDADHSVEDVTTTGRSRRGRDRTRSRTRSRGHADVGDSPGGVVTDEPGPAEAADGTDTSDQTAAAVDDRRDEGAERGSGDDDVDQGSGRRRRRRGRRGRGGRGKRSSGDRDGGRDERGGDQVGAEPAAVASERADDADAREGEPRDGGSDGDPAQEPAEQDTASARGSRTRVRDPESDDTAATSDRRSTRSSGGTSSNRGRTRTRDAVNRDGTSDAADSDTVRDPQDDGVERDEAAPDGDVDEVEEAIARGGTRMAAKRGNRRHNGGGGSGRRHQRPGGVPEEVRRAILEGPPRTMLATAREDRTQIAVLEDRTVVEHYVTRKEDVTYVGNIYMARVQNVLPGMEAAFLDIGKGRNGVLYAGEVLYDELDLEEGEDERIENVLKPGQKVLVQVTKDPMGSKGPRLTMHLSLAGRYMVLAPGSDLFGISRKLTDRERDRLRRIVKKVKPDQHGVIVRTAAEGASEEQILADVERLLTKWAKVEEAAEGAKALTTVYEEPSLVVKVIRDNFGPEFERCIVDDEELYHQVRSYLDEVAPELIGKVELYGAPTADTRSKAAGAPALENLPARSEPDADATESQDTADVDAADGDAADGDAGAVDTVQVTAPTSDVDLEAAATRRQSLPPLFDAYDVTDQLRRAMGRKVWLPSGGYLIIETTEAMKVIDVNTGKFTGGADTNLEEVVLKTNLEAAEEIVRQLRLRDMGGIIIIDFIDMLLKANQDQVVRRLKRELLRDRTKTRVSEVSRLGLVQMTRKNVSQGLIESFSHACEACDGRGIVSELD